MNKAHEINAHQKITLDLDFCRGVVECSKKCQQALVQVLYYEEIPRKEKDKPLRYNVAISDGFCYFRAAFCHEASRKIHDNHLGRYDVIFITKYIVSQLTSQGTTLVMVTDYERKISGVKRIIGKPVYITDYKLAKCHNPFGVNTIPYEDLFQEPKASDITNDLYSQFMKTTPLEITVSFHADTPQKNLPSQMDENTTKKKVMSRKLFNNDDNDQETNKGGDTPNEKLLQLQLSQEEEDNKRTPVKQEASESLENKNQAKEYRTSFLRTRTMQVEQKEPVVEKQEEKATEKKGTISSSSRAYKPKAFTRVSQRIKPKPEESNEKSIFEENAEQNLKSFMSLKPLKLKLKANENNAGTSIEYEHKEDQQEIMETENKPQSQTSTMSRNSQENKKNIMKNDNDDMDENAQLMALLYPPNENESDNDMVYITPSKGALPTTDMNIMDAQIEMNNHVELPPKLENSLIVEIEEMIDHQAAQPMSLAPIEELTEEMEMPQRRYEPIEEEFPKEDKSIRVSRKATIEQKERIEAEKIFDITMEKFPEPKPVRRVRFKEPAYKQSEFSKEIAEDKKLRQQQEQFLNLLRQKQQKERQSLPATMPIDPIEKPRTSEPKANRKDKEKEKAPQKEKDKNGVSTKYKTESIVFQPNLPLIQVEEIQKAPEPERISVEYIQPQQPQQPVNIFMKPADSSSKEGGGRQSPFKMFPTVQMHQTELRQRNEIQEALMQIAMRNQQKDKSLMLPPLDLTQFTQQSGIFSGRSPTMSQLQTQLIIPISTLTYLSNNWIIKARVVQKSSLKPLQTKNGRQINLFSIEVVDKDRGEIEVIFFGSACNTYFEKIKVGCIYLFSGGIIKNAAIQQTTSVNDIQIVFENQADIKEAPDDGTIPLNVFRFCSVTDIQTKQMGEVIDFVGIIYEVEDMTEVAGRNGQKIQKRQFQAYDKGCQTIEITLWGDHCNVPLRKDGMIIAKRLKVNQYMERKFLISSSKTMVITRDFPTQVPEVYEIAKLLEKKTAKFEVEKKVYQRHLIGDVLDLQQYLRKTEKHYFDVTASIIHIQQDMMSTLYYLSCMKDNCMKKVVEVSPTHWKCPACKEMTSNPKPRYTLSMLISDFSGSLWVNAFDHIGENILKHPASYIKLLRESDKMEDKTEFQKIMRAPISKEYNIKLLVKYEEYKGREEWKCSILKITPLNYAEEGHRTLQLLDRYLS